MSMLQGDGHTVQLHRDGWLWDTAGYLSIAVDIRQLDPVDVDPRTGVTLDQTLTKDFERHATSASYTRSFSHGLNPALTVGPRLRDNVESLPTLPSTDPEGTGSPVVDTRTLGTVGLPVTFAGGRTIATSTTVTAPRAELERGDKTTGGDYTRLAANEVIWWFAYRPAIDQPATVIGVRIEDEALLLWAPTGQVPSLLDRVETPAPPARPGADAVPPVVTPRPRSFPRRRQTGELTVDWDAMMTKVELLADSFEQVARYQEDEIGRERFLLNAVSEAREAGAENVDGIAAPVVHPRTTLNRAAARLAALRFDHRERLAKLTPHHLPAPHHPLRPRPAPPPPRTPTSAH